MEKQIVQFEQIILEETLATQKQKHEGSSRQSIYLQEYLRMMDCADFQSCKNNQSKIIASLSNHNPSFHVQADPSLKISVIESSRDCEYAFLEVRYNRFEFYVWVLNVDEESPSHKIEKSHKGNFSTVQHTRHNNGDIAIKCTAFRKKTFQKVFRDTLLEYLALKMSVELDCGPALPKIFAFDMVIFRNCIQFSLEFCSHRLQLGPSLANDLIFALRSLHCINIIHFDIKPQNICFSEKTGKAVFIDFGLHEVVREEVGQTSTTNFKGSLLMCSEEMRQVFMEGSGVADVYYNDAVCLTESLKEITSKDLKIVYQVKPVFDLRQTQLHLLIKIKHLLLKINSQAKSSSSVQQSHFIAMASQLGSSQFEQLINFINSLVYSVYLEEIVVKLQKKYPQINAQYLISARFKKKLQTNAGQQSNQQHQFEIRLKLIKRLSNFNIINDQSQQILQEHLALLSDQTKAAKLAQQTYYRLFAQIEQINSWKASNQAKKVSALTFNKLWLQDQTLESMSLKEKQGKCFLHICQYIKRHTILDKSLFSLIRYSLLSAILLQIYNTSYLKSFFSTILEMQCTPTTKIRLFIHCLSCIEWIPQCITIYNYYYFKNIIYSYILDYLSKISQQQRKPIQEYTDLFGTYLISGSVKNKRLREKLSKFQQRLCNKYYKYYTAIRQKEQLLAQIYVYTLHVLMKMFENCLNVSFDLFNKLIALRSFRKQAKLCIFDYYEHSISNILFRDEQYLSLFLNMQANNLLSTQYINNHYCSPQQQYGRNVQIRENTIFLHNKDLSKMNKQQAFYHRISIFVACNSLVLMATRFKLVFDLPSLTKALSLAEAQNFLPQLKAFAEYESYHPHFDIPHQFGQIYKSVLCYLRMYQSGLQDLLQIDIAYQLSDQLIQFIDNLKCVNCKFRCLQIYFMNNGPKHENIDIQILQNYLLQHIIWRMKQSQLYIIETAEMIGDLCFLSNHKKSYEIILVEYIMFNNIMPTIFYNYLLEYKLSYHKRLLHTIWELRFVLDQDGNSLFFRFIFYLCRHFQQSKFRNQQYIKCFCKMLGLLFEGMDYEDFFAHNSQFLYDNRHRLLVNQPYSALYFSIILNNPYGQLRQIVRPFYYIFICKLCHLLNTPCRVDARWSLYLSYVKNQAKCLPITTQRRFFFLLKLEYKNYTAYKNYDLDRLLRKKIKMINAKSRRNQASHTYHQIKKKIEAYFDLNKST